MKVLEIVSEKRIRCQVLINDMQFVCRHVVDW